MADHEQLADVPCLACGCLCDDITLHLVGGRIQRAERACPLGDRWFVAQRPLIEPACLVDGRAAPLADACDRAAQILTRARQPLLFGLAGATCEAQRVAVEVADRLGAAIDVGDVAAAALASAARSTGLVTATLGEVRHRADVVLFWDADALTTHPRHLERYSLDCRGELAPRGLADRTLIVVDSRSTATAARADLFVEIPPEGDSEAVARLRSLLLGSGRSGSSETVASGQVDAPGWETSLREAANHILAGRYVALFFDAARFPADGTLAELLALVRDLNGLTRCVALPLGAAGNGAGAEQVLTWQTGYPGSISFAAGYPQFDPAAHSAAAMLGGGADAALVVVCDSLVDPLAMLPEAARQRAATIPLIALHTADFAPAPGAAVSITVATPGIDAGGTVFRSDGVALRLRPALESSYLSAEKVLQAIAARIAAQPAVPAP